MEILIIFIPVLVFGLLALIIPLFLTEEQITGEPVEVENELTNFPFSRKCMFFGHDLEIVKNRGGLFIEVNGVLAPLPSFLEMEEKIMTCNRCKNRLATYEEVFESEFNKEIVDISRRASQEELNNFLYE